MRTCVVVTGREGVWRLQNFDLESSDSEVKEVLSDIFFVLTDDVFVSPHLQDP